MPNNYSKFAAEIWRKDLKLTVALAFRDSRLIKQKPSSELVQRTVYFFKQAAIATFYQP